MSALSRVAFHRKTRKLSFSKISLKPKPMAQYPFLHKKFFAALEDSGSTSSLTGWEACHLQMDSSQVEGQLPGKIFMPLYKKIHSYGEYVFDWAWANAYRQHGLNYYPKLLTAAPFSPASGPRLRQDEHTDLQNLNPEISKQIFKQVKNIALETGASSWHLLFPDTPTQNLFVNDELIRRSGVQFHWFNTTTEKPRPNTEQPDTPYENFEHFLDSLVSRKRKMVRRERNGIGRQGLSTVMLQGPEIGADLWDFFFQLYQHTYLKRSGNRGYLNREFFHQIGETMADQIAMSVAYDAGQPVACALYFFDDQTLYGRYWGCAKEYDYLHFELCYYQGIDFAIANKLTKFDAGAQGEHKLLRGFEPVKTWSLHWIQHAEFAEAIRRFVQHEHTANEKYISQAREVLPYRAEV